MYADPYAQQGATYIAPATYVAPVPTYVPAYEVGRSSNFKKLNCCALLSALIIFAVLIAAATVCWYSYNETYTGVSAASTTTGSSTTTTLNYTRSCYDLQGVATAFKASTASEINTYVEYDSSTSLWSIFKLMQAFVLIGLILAGLLSIFLLVVFADSVRNRLLFVLGMNVLRIVLLVIAILILISMIICFLGFLGITQAFSDDNTNCTRGDCKRFADDVKQDVGTQSVTVNGVTSVLAVTQAVTFGPVEGWYLVLACIPVAILLSALTILNKFPIPVDSVGSGEAL